MVAEVLLVLLALTTLIGLIQLVNSPLSIIEDRENSYPLVLIDYVSINNTTLLIVFDENVHIRTTYPNATILVFRNDKWINTLDIEAGDLVLVKIKDSNFRKLLFVTNSGIIVLKNPYVGENG